MKSANSVVESMKHAWVNDAPYAAFHIAMVYDNGWGVEENPREAFKWFKRAADAGVEAAFYHVATSYFWGLGTRKNSKAGYYWFCQAARVRDTLAEQAIAQCLIEGLGVRANPKAGLAAMAKLSRFRGGAAVYLCDYHLRRYRFALARKYALRAKSLREPHAAAWLRLVDESTRKLGKRRPKGHT